MKLRQLDHDDYMPAFAQITSAKVNDQITLKTLRLNPGSFVAPDAAYIDFAIYSAWTEQGIFFVTRMRRSTVYEVIERRRLPRNRNSLSDEASVLGEAPGRCPYDLRRLVVFDRENDREIVLLSNHLDLTTTIPPSQDRWQIEICFKARNRI